MKMRHGKLMHGGQARGLLVTGGMLLTAIVWQSAGGMVRAQPDPAGQGKAANQERMPVWNTMTPQQRHEFKQRLFEKSIRRALSDAGFRDQPTQDPVIVFVRQREDACQELRDKAQQIVALLRANTDDVDMKNAVSDLREAVAREKVQRAEALLKLDEEIAYTQNPRLEAVLITLGVLGDEFNYLLTRALYIRDDIPKAVLYN